MSDKKNGCRLRLNDAYETRWWCNHSDQCDFYKSGGHDRCINAVEWGTCTSREAISAEAARVHDAIREWLPVESDADDQRDTLRATPCTYLRWSESQCPGNIEGLVALTPLAADQRDTLRATPCTYLRWSESRCPGNIEGLVSLTPLAAMVGSNVEGECLPVVKIDAQKCASSFRRAISEAADDIRKERPALGDDEKWNGVFQTPDNPDEYVDPDVLDEERR